MTMIGNFDEWVRLGQMAERGAAAAHDGDKCLGVFFWHPVEDPEETRKAGRVVYRDVAMCKIIVPGARDHVVEPASPENRQRFAKAWEAFQAQQTGLVDGTPLEYWPYLTPAKVANLHAIGIYSVEALAAVHDGNLDRLGMGGRELRERAEQYLQPASETEQELREKVAKLEATVQALQARLEQVGAAADDDADDQPPVPARRRSRNAA